MRTYIRTYVSLYNKHLFYLGILLIATANQIFGTFVRKTMEYKSACEIV
jgi:hypothetical protein